MPLLPTGTGPGSVVHTCAKLFFSPCPTRSALGSVLPRWRASGADPRDWRGFIANRRRGTRRPIPMYTPWVGTAFKRPFGLNPLDACDPVRPHPTVYQSGRATSSEETRTPDTRKGPRLRRSFSTTGARALRGMLYEWTTSSVLLRSAPLPAHCETLPITTTALAKEADFRSLGDLAQRAMVALTKRLLACLPLSWRLRKSLRGK